MSGTNYMMIGLQEGATYIGVLMVCLAALDLICYFMTGNSIILAIAELVQKVRSWINAKKQ